MGFFSNFAAMRASQGIPDPVHAEPVSGSSFSPTLFEEPQPENDDNGTVTLFDDPVIYQIPERSGAPSLKSKQTNTIVVYQTNASGVIYDRTITWIVEVIDPYTNYTMSYTSYSATSYATTTATYWVFATKTFLYSFAKSNAYIYVIVMWSGAIGVILILLGLSYFCDCGFFHCSCSSPSRSSDTRSNTNNTRSNTSSNPTPSSTRSPQDLTPEEIELAAIREQNEAPVPASTYQYSPTVAPPPSAGENYSDVKKPESDEAAKYAAENAAPVTDPMSNPYMNVQTEDEKWD